MKSSSIKKASITLPSELEEGLQQLAKAEHRTFSGVVQEAVRYYLGVRKLDSLQQELSAKARSMGITGEDDVEQVVHDHRKRK